MTGRIFAVGDVHGRLDKLETLLGRLPLAPDDRLVFLGDSLNRGGQASQVLERLLALRAERPDTAFLKGNHEQAVLRYGRTRDPEDLRLLRDIGFQATLDSYGRLAFCGLDFMPLEHEEFLEGLLPWLVVAPYVFFHAPLAWGRNPAEATPDELENLLSGRELDGPGWAASGRTLIFGHVPLETPLVAPGLVGIDTGAGHNHLLSAVELPALRFFHAQPGAAPPAWSAAVWTWTCPARSGRLPGGLFLDARQRTAPAAERSGGCCMCCAAAGGHVPPVPGGAAGQAAPRRPGRTGRGSGGNP